MVWRRRTLMAAVMTSWAWPVSATLFPEQQWQRRIFLIFAPDEDHEGFKLMRAQTRTPKLAARDVDRVEVTGNTVRFNGREVEQPTAGELRDFYDVSRGGFAVRLIGKDGVVKLARSRAIQIDELFQIIDTMPEGPMPEGQPPAAG